jgi:hypothetical protein
VRICIEKGLVKGESVMMDGSLIKADAALSSLVPKEKSVEEEEKRDNGVIVLKSARGKKPSKYIRERNFQTTHTSARLIQIAL